MSLKKEDHYLEVEPGDAEPVGVKDKEEEASSSGCACLIVPLIVFMVLVLIGPIAWMYLENIAADDPSLAFDVVQGCELTATSYQLQLPGDGTCFDRFMFVFTPPGTSTEFEQIQLIRVVPDALCADVNMTKPTLPLGTYPCSRVRGVFAPYSGAFNCATPTTSVEETCYSLVPVTTNHNPTMAFVIGPIVLVAGCAVSSFVLTRVVK